jgi:hypothetical protein
MAEQVIDQFRDASNQQLVDAGDSTNTAIRVNIVAGGGTGGTGGGGVQYPVGTAPATATGNVILGVATSGTVLAPTAVPFTHSTAIAVEIVDASGNQITSFGGGTTTVVGTVTSVPSGTTIISGTVVDTGTVTTVPTGTQSVAQTGSPWGVTGTVTAVESGTWSVTVSGTTTVAPTGTQTVAGTVTSVPSGTTTVAGSVTAFGTATIVGTETVAVTGIDTYNQAVGGGTSGFTTALAVADKELYRRLDNVADEIAKLHDSFINNDRPKTRPTARRGPRLVSDGQYGDLRIARDSALVTCDGHTRYFETVMQGNCFWAYSNNVTPSNLNATCVGLILYNPINSGVVISPIALTGNLGGALLANNTAYTLRIDAGLGPNVTLPTGTTALTINNAVLGLQSKVSHAIAYSTATFAAAPTQCMNLFNWQVIGFAGTATTTPGVAAFSSPMFTDFGGMLAIAPGAFICVGIGAASVAMNMNILWEENPIV